MIKSPLRYPGGKSRSAEKIASLIPKFDEYREPFLGGGSVYIHLKQQFPNKQFWVNDLYFELYKFWEMCQNDVQSVVNQVYTWRNDYPIGKNLHQFLGENMSRFNDIEKASAFFIFNRLTFSGTTEAGGFSQQAFEGRFTISSIERLTPFNKVIQNTNITNFDYEALLEADGENVFIFLDPPYFSATKSALYGKNGKLHKGFDHERFAKSLKNCKHQWLMTYDNSSYITDLFDFAFISTWDLTYGMRNVTSQSNQKEKELFISNYPIFETPKQALRLFADPPIIYG
jgi:DNA adenine methylase